MRPSTAAMLPEVWVHSKLFSSGTFTHALPDDVSSMETRLESDLRYTREVDFEVHHVADLEHLWVARVMSNPVSP